MYEYQQIAEIREDGYENKVNEKNALCPDRRSGSFLPGSVQQ